MFYKYTSTQPFPNFYCWCLFTAFSFGELCTILIMSITSHVFLFAESGSTKRSLVNLSSWLHLVSICWEFSCLSSHSDIVDGHYLYLCSQVVTSLLSLPSSFATATFDKKHRKSLAPCLIICCSLDLFLTWCCCSLSLFIQILVNLSLIFFLSNYKGNVLTSELKFVTWIWNS